MALDYDVPEDKRALYWLGDKLIEFRNPVMILVLVVTAMFAYWSLQLQLVTSFGDLLPQSHEVVNVYGLIVSLDDKAALIRANFIEGRLDYRRIFDEVNAKVVDPYGSSNVDIYVAGEPRLYGWVYRYAGDVFWILVVTYCIEWVLR